MEGASPVSREVQKRLCEIFPSAQIGQAYGNFRDGLVFVMLCLLTDKKSRSYRDDNDAGDGVSNAETRAFRK